MRRLTAFLVAAATVASTLAGSAPGATFTVVSKSTGNLPSFVEPNGPGAIAVPFSLSTPPERPAVRSYDELLELWRRAGDGYGVPWQVLAAINKIESNFGRNMGPSSAGALGWMQFIPSSWARWGMDADGDGVADPWDPEDAVFAAARYLAAAGAHDDLPRAIFAYNHAQWYVDEVLALAQLFGDAPLAPADSGAALFEASDLEERLAAARRGVTGAKRAISRAEARVEQVEQQQLALAKRAGNPSLSDDSFGQLDERIARLEPRRERAAGAVERAYAELDYAVRALDQLRSEAAAASALSSSTGSFLGDGESSGAYVFPVGGGPALVSVAHGHHDYPAADVAAPEGSPVYALASSVVTEAYPDGNGKCGIGLKLRVETGGVWVYCHLAYLEPDVTPGAALAAGTPVGLVGATGNATGPHLHLSLDPAVAFPQEQPWFESFAGTAFSWQDAETPTPAGGPETRVFRIVSGPDVPSGAPVVTFTR